MNLTKRDKDVLKSFGYSDKDFEQIQNATLKKYTTYELNDELIPLEAVLDKLSREEYLSGIGRSAFHYSAVRHTQNGEAIYFNSYKLFE